MYPRFVNRKYKVTDRNVNNPASPVVVTYHATMDAVRRNYRVAYPEIVTLRASMLAKGPCTFDNLENTSYQITVEINNENKI